MIELRDVGFSYGTADVLRGVSLVVRPGERVVLLGRNGSGKSTLSRLVNGSLAACSGEVTVDGIASTPETRRAIASAVGYVRQDPRNQIVSPLVLDEVEFGPRNLGLPREEVRRRAERALEACGIDRLCARMTDELSGGQQQLLSLAGVLAMGPRYLVLDEVGSHLDEASRAVIADLVRRLVRGGTGVLEVAHGPEALFGASRVVVLEGGRIAWEGRPDDFMRSEGALKASGLADDPLAALESVRPDDLRGRRLIIPFRQNVQSELFNWLGGIYDEKNIICVSNMSTNAAMPTSAPNRQPPVPASFLAGAASCSSSLFTAASSARS